MSNQSKPDLRAFWLASAARQAIQYFKTGTYKLPRGFITAATFGNKLYPRLGFIAESPKSILIAIRGTESPLELVKDLKVGQIPFPYARHAGSTHDGFTTLYSSVVRQPVMDVLKRSSSRKKLFVTGHSLGGSIAYLLALDAAIHTRFRKPIVYTYGSPRVGNPEFASFFNRTVPRCYRVVNVYDLVPNYPPASLIGIRYKHAGRMISISFQTGSLLGNHQIDGYVRELSHTIK